MITKGFSVVVCCYNSANRLPETLKYLSRLQLPQGLPCELIIVDNACTDNTAATAASEWRKYRTAIDFKIVEEPEPGLSNARKKGFIEARYEFVVMCDDDNWLEHNYLVKTLDVYEKHPEIGVLGGKGFPVCEVDPPEWLKYTKLFATGDQAGECGPVATKKVYGAGAVVRKSAYEKLNAVGFESALTDRLKNALSSGNDFEMCMAIYFAGYEIWFDNTLHFYHFFPKERLSTNYYYALIEASVKCVTILDGYSLVLFRNRISKFRINNYLIKQLVHSKKEYYHFKKLSVQHSKTSGFGIFVRFRMRYFSLRIKGIVSDYGRIFTYASNALELKKKLRRMNDVAK